MKYKPSLVAKVILAWLPMTLCGAAPNRVPVLEDFLVQVWDTDSGLPHSTVTSIAQTPDGYLWVGTMHGGLSRFDGTRFVNFHPGNTPELNSVEIQNLVVDAQGTLWIGTVEGALLSCRSGKFRFERQSTKTPQAWLSAVVAAGTNSVVLASFDGWLFRGTKLTQSNVWETLQSPDAIANSSLCSDLQGVIWYRTQDGRLGQVRGNRFVPMLNPPGLNGRQVNALTIDSVGQLWAGTERELARWNGAEFVAMVKTNGGANLVVQQLAACADGSMWVMTDRELRKWQEGKWVARVESWDGESPRSSYFPGGIFGNSRTLRGDSRGGLWVSYYGDGLWHADASGKVSRVRESQGLPNARVECWFEDREGNVWLGLYGGGLACVRQRTFHTVWPASGATRLAARSICQDQFGAMWFGTSENTLLRWHDRQFTSFTPPVEPSAVMGLDLAVFPGVDGELWVGSANNGMVTLDQGAFSRPFASADIGTVARVIFKDRRDRMWIGSEFGLFCWENSHLRRFTSSHGFPTAYVLAITEDAKGDLWIGTGIGELWRYRDGQFTNYRPLDSFTDPQSFAAAAGADALHDRSRGALTGGERFWALHAEVDGVIWIGTLGGGLLRFQDGKFTRYTLRDGLPNEHVSQILADERGQLWLGTRGGIARVSKSELNRFALGKQSFVHFVTYGKFDGLPAAECAGGSQPACWRSEDGRLWFATAKGVVWVDPTDTRFNALPPPVVIEEVAVDGQSLIHVGTTRLRVPAGRHYLDFKFTAPSLTSPDNVRFKWRLAGLETEWVTENRRRTVSYSFVPPGDYEFQVQACNNDGVWNQAGASVKLFVSPFTWQTWWFKTVLGLAAAGILFAIYSVRIARLRSMQRLRLSIARDLHDEVAANLASISLVAQEMQKRPCEDDAKEVFDIATETSDTLRDIVWFIDPRPNRLDDLVARLSDTARHLLRQVAYEFEQSGDFTSAKLPLAFRRNVPPLFKEALHNILKHAHATEVRISVRRWGDNFEFQITDNGVGFDAAAATAGNGLKNMRWRAAEIGGHVEIARRPGGGTSVTLTASIAKTRDRQ